MTPEKVRAEKETNQSLASRLRENWQILYSLSFVTVFGGGLSLVGPSSWYFNSDEALDISAKIGWGMIGVSLASAVAVATGSFIARAAQRLTDEPIQQQMQKYLFNTVNIHLP